MVSWIQGLRLRDQFIKYVSLLDWLPLLKKLSANDSMVKYATHLVYLTDSTDLTQIERGITHSILQGSPKRADVYYLVHVVTTDEPYTKTHHVDTVLPADLVRIDFHLGFRVDHAINHMSRQVVMGLVQNKKIDITPRYNFLREQDIAGNFQFVLLNHTLSYVQGLSVRQRLVAGVLLESRSNCVTLQKRTVFWRALRGYSDELETQFFQDIS